MDDTTPFQDHNTHSKMNKMSEPNLDESNNYIHPTAIVGSDVRLGKNNHIGAFCYIVGNTIIGNNNRFEAFCSIGTEPEHIDYFGKPNKGVVIGNNNRFREFINITSGCENPTILKNDIIVLNGTYIGHDSVINSNCILTSNVLISGHCLLGEYVNMGLGSKCHQFTKIASGSMIGMGAIITKKTKTKCFGLYVGIPARYVKENDYLKSKFTAKEVQKIIEEFENIQL